MRRVLVLAVVLCAPWGLAQESDTAVADDLAKDLAGNDDGFFDSGLGYGIALGGTGLVALLGALYFLGVGGLRHVDADNVLEHPLRAQLLETVQTDPGIHLRELAQRHDTAVTNTQWHLRKLEQAGLVRTQKVGGRRLFYPTAGGVGSRAQALQNAATANPNAAALLQFIQDRPGSNQRGLADGLDMNPGTVRWHLRRLEDAGLIRSVPEGVQTRYFGAGRPPRPARRMDAGDEAVEVAA